MDVTARGNPLKSSTGLSTTVSATVQDTPQVVNVISRQLIEEQHITTLEQALRDSPGITVAIGEGGTLAGDQFKIRGLDANNDIYIDGLRDFGVYARDAFDYEQVQVLKGPAGAMFGRGTTGGAINTISKQASTRRNFISADATVGTGDYYRVTADINHVINDTTALRLNLMGNSTGVTGRDRGGQSDRWGVAANLGFGLGTSQELRAELPPPGRPIAFPDYGIIIGAPTGVIRASAGHRIWPQHAQVFEQFDGDKDRTRADILTGRLTWALLPQADPVQRYAPGQLRPVFPVHQRGQLPRQFAVTKQTCVDALIDNNPATLPLITFGGGSPYGQRAWGFQNISSLHGEFELFGLKNEIVAGTDFNHQENRKTFYAYTLPPLSSGIYAPGTTVAARNAIAINLLEGRGRHAGGLCGVQAGDVRPGVAATGIPLTNITTSRLHPELVSAWPTTRRASSPTACGSRPRSR